MGSRVWPQERTQERLRKTTRKRLGPLGPRETKPRAAVSAKQVESQDSKDRGADPSHRVGVRVVYTGKGGESPVHFHWRVHFLVSSKATGWGRAGRGTHERGQPYHPWSPVVTRGQVLTTCGGCRMAGGKRGRDGGICSLPIKDSELERVFLPSSSLLSFHLPAFFPSSPRPSPGETRKLGQAGAPWLAVIYYWSHILHSAA